VAAGVVADEDAGLMGSVFEDIGGEPLRGGADGVDVKAACAYTHVGAHAASPEGDCGVESIMKGFGIMP